MIIRDRIAHRWFGWASYTPHWRNCAHQAPTWLPDRRCTGCGHRKGPGGVPPQPILQTRELPVILWPFELAARIEAVLRGRLDRKGRLPL